jgi:hypothetical protein
MKGYKGSGGGTKTGTKINPNKGAQGGGKSWTQTMIDKHGPSPYTAIGDPSDFDGIGEK